MKYFLLPIALLCWTITATAQDIIVSMEDTDVEAKVENVNSQRTNAQNNHYDVATFKYPYPPVSRTYNIGDYFDEGGVQGLVIYVTDQGRHGLILSLYDVTKTSYSVLPMKDRYKWSLEIGNFGATDENDGYLNKLAIEKYIVEHDRNYDYFPLFCMVASLGEGWYIPSINECVLIEETRNGGSLTYRNASAIKAFDKHYRTLARQVAGKDRAASPFMYDIVSSTECGPKEFFYHSYCPPFDPEKSSDNKTRSFSREYEIKPIHKF